MHVHICRCVYMCICMWVNQDNGRFSGTKVKAYVKIGFLGSPYSLQAVLCYFYQPGEKASFSSLEISLRPEQDTLCFLLKVLQLSVCCGCPSVFKSSAPASSQYEHCQTSRIPRGESQTYSHSPVVQTNDTSWSLQCPHIP